MRPRNRCLGTTVGLAILAAAALLALACGGATDDEPTGGGGAATGGTMPSGGAKSGGATASGSAATGGTGPCGTTSGASPLATGGGASALLPPGCTGGEVHVSYVRFEVGTVPIGSWGSRPPSMATNGPTATTLSERRSITRDCETCGAVETCRAEPVTDAPTGSGNGRLRHVGAR